MAKKEFDSTIEAIEATREAGRAKADAAVDARIAHFKKKCLDQHLSGNTPPGELNPDTLTSAEVKAILAGLSKKKADVGKGGSQDSVDVCLEYLKDDASATAAFKAATKE